VRPELKEGLFAQGQHRCARRRGRRLGRSALLRRTHSGFCLTLLSFIFSCGFGFIRTRATPSTAWFLPSSDFDMSKPPGRCVFCGGTGLTKGHVWPDWLNKILPKTATYHEHETGKFITFETSILGPAHSVRIEQGHARTRKPRNTCLRCNGGWMSTLEGFTRGCTSRLILGIPQLMGLGDQGALASLLTLIAMRIEFLGEMRAISDQERDWLRYYREPTNDWKIWISSFGGDDAEEHWSRTYAGQLDSKPADKVGPEYCNIRVTTLVIGKLCAHLFYSPVIDFEGYEGIHLTQIWPRRHLYVDTSRLSVMSGRDAIFLHEAFARAVPPLPAA
jgi:hypothetical protein